MPGEQDTQTLYGYETLRGAPPPPEKPMRILSMEYCPFAERARIVANKHGVEHDVINCDLSNKPAFLFEHSPNGQVPALIHEGHSLFESEIIVEYLENRFPETATLYPKDPAARAEARQLSVQHGSKIMPNFYKVLSAAKSGEADKLQEAVDNFHKGVQTWAEDKLGDGPFFGGAAENVTDILVFPWLNRAEVITASGRHGLLPADKFPKVLRYIQAMRQLPYIQKTSPSAENLMAFFDSYKNAADGKPVGFNIASKVPFYAGPPKASA